MSDIVTVDKEGVTGIIVPKAYEIDFDKVKTLEDVIGILKTLNIRFCGVEYVKDIRHLVREVKEKA
jgi:hypothetical protein